MHTRIRTLLIAAIPTLFVVPAEAQNSFGQADQPQQQQQPPQYQQGQYQNPNQPGYPPASQQPAYSDGQQPGGYQGGGYQGNNPPQPGYYSGQPGAPGGQAGADLDQLMQMERQDFGVAPTNQLHPGPMHGPTPASIPGGQVITTKGLVALLANPSVGALVFDVLGGPEILPRAIAAVPAHQAGDFNDQTQQQFGQFLQQMTQGRKDVPLVLYCQSSHCWMSYNASLRAIHLGYSNVLWYRGGIEAWKMGGQQTQGQQGGYGAPQGGGNYPPGGNPPGNNYPPPNGNYPPGGNDPSGRW